MSPLRWMAGALLVLSNAACVSLDPQPTTRALIVDLGARSTTRLEWPTAPSTDPSTTPTATATAADLALLADGLSPQEVVELSWHHHPGIQAELTELGIDHAAFVQASRLRNPSLELGRFSASGAEGGVSREVGFAFDFLDALLLPLRRKMAAMELEAQRLRLGHHLLEVAADSQNAFWELAAAEKKVERFTVLRDLDAAAAELAERQYQAGNVSSLELEEIRASWHRSRLELAEARLAARVAREVLVRRLGLWGPQTTGWRILPPSDELPNEEIPLAELEKVALATRLDLRAAKAAVDLVAKALSVKKGTRFAPVGIEVGIHREKEADGIRLTGPTLSLELPIFDTGAAEIAQLELELTKSRLQLDALAIDVRSQVREAHDRLIAARDLYRFYQQTLLPHQGKIVDQQLRHVNMMIHGVYELVAARKEQVMSESEAIEAWRDYWQARVELARVLGGDLELVLAREGQKAASQGATP